MFVYGAEPLPEFTKLFFEFPGMKKKEPRVKGGFLF
jgi:hypothetical protein